MRPLPPGIKRHPLGFRVWVRLYHGPGGMKSKVFPPGTGLITMRKWREEQRGTPYEKPQPVTGFEKDVETYLKTVKGMPTYSWRQKDLEAWTSAFQQRPRSSITSADIRAQLAAWQATGSQKGGPLAASTLNHRRTALMHLYRVLDGKAAANPVKDVPKLREPAPEPRGLPYATIRRICWRIPAGATKARLQVMAYTGIPQAQLAQITEADIDWKRHTVFVQGRKKGAGTRGHVLPLSKDALLAFKAMKRWDAFGHFSRECLRMSFQRACRKAGVTGVRPYDLRHSFGTAVYAASGDIRATQILMGHASPAMTYRYTLGAVEGRAQAAVEAFGEHLATPKGNIKRNQARKRA